MLLNGNYKVFIFNLQKEFQHLSLIKIINVQGHNSCIIKRTTHIDNYNSDDDGDDDNDNDDLKQGGNICNIMHC